MITALLVAALLSPQAPAAAPSTPGEIVHEIRVQGNATLSDAFVIQLSGVALNQPLDPGGTEAIAKRLRDSGRFDFVDVRKRYRTLEMNDLVLVLLVHEKPGVTPAGAPPSPLRRLQSRVMFLPIVRYEDGYGWTYGGLASTTNLFGGHERIAVPLSWGATKRAALEADRTFSHGPFTRVLASFGVEQRENPFFSLGDHRVRWSGRVERRVHDDVVFGGSLGRDEIRFGQTHDRVWSEGADAAIDTRQDPAYPMDAVYAGVFWNALHPMGDASFGSAGAVNQVRYDARGYKRLFGAAVLGAHAELDTASAPLPQYDEWLLGGPVVRGLPTGAFAGDTRRFWSAELRVPFTSPIVSIARTGFDLFVDGGKTAAFGAPLSGIREQHAAGAGLFLIATVIQLNLDVARSFDGRGTRVHFGTGFTF